MNELIELTSKEAMLSGVIVSMKDICDAQGIRHDNAMRDFKKELTKLDSETAASIAPHLEELNYSLNKGQTYPTIGMPLKTAVWFFTKYDAQLRHNIVDYAFSKMTEEFTEQIEQDQKEIGLLTKQVVKLESDKFVNWSTTDKTVSRFIKENSLSVTPTDFLNKLEECGELKTVEVLTTKRILTEESVGSYTDKGSLTFPEDFLRSIAQSMEVM